MKFNGIVRKASASQSTLKDQSEHCSFDPEQLAAAGLAVGRQVRVRRSPTNVVLYTVSEDHPETVNTTIRMALPARQRLMPADAEEKLDVTVETEVPKASLSDEEAAARSEFVERLTDHGHQKKLVVLAPHGGAIESETDRQAERVAEILGAHRASVWLCRGFRQGGGAHRQWHITSSDIDDHSFPLLRSIAHRRFEHAVAFHGFSEDYVLVGGRAPRALKKRVAAEIEKVLAPKIEVRIARTSDKFNGDEPRNIVNRLTDGGIGGVQIEQPLEARNRYWEAIAEGVAGVFAAG